MKERPHHNPDDLIVLFNAVFAESENTLLVRGDSEPLYLPADADNPRHRVIFAHGFFASALHEIAHWCIAGSARRRQVDYGYWYQPDGRDSDRQAAFESVEAKPQAIEWAFSIACAFRFRVSVDNLSGVEVDRKSFAMRVHRQLLRYVQNGFPERAECFIDILCRKWGVQWRLPEGPETAI
jgi:elongation factor P hydroxylase